RDRDDGAPPVRGVRNDPHLPGARHRREGGDLADRQELSAMQTMARARFVRVSARKARLVLDQIRGKAVAEALATLEYTPRAAARLVEKGLRSAGGDPQRNHPGAN